jgi:AraC-like DNA-binding protein
VYAEAGSATIHYGSAPYSPDRTIMVGGNVNFDDTTAALLLDVLPPIVCIGAASPSAEIVRPILQMLGDEIARSAPGTAVMAEHLTRILFIQALRALLADDGSEAPGWLGALNDPQIGPALTLMHEQASQHWTVASLATAVSMSRSAFSLRFKERVGLPPLEYLLRWRIRAAAHALQSGDRTVASVAAESGYASESAFSNAFKRVTGASPAQYRSKARSISLGGPA